MQTSFAVSKELDLAVLLSVEEMRMLAFACEKVSEQRWELSRKLRCAARLVGNG